MTIVIRNQGPRWVHPLRRIGNWFRRWLAVFGLIAAAAVAAHVFWK
jgi:hypothetical protein